MKKDKVIQEFLSYSLGPGAAALLGFAAVPLTTWLVVPEEFGRAAMFTTFQSLIGLGLYLGMDQGFVREYHDTEYATNLLHKAAFLPLSLSLIAFLALWFFYEWFSLLLFGTKTFFPVFYLGLSIPLWVLNRFSLVILRMEQRALHYSLVSIFEKTLQLLLVISFLLLFNRSFEQIVQAYFFSQCLTSLFSFFLTRKTWLGKTGVSSVSIQTLLAFGLPLVPSSIMTWVFNSMDRVALRSWSDFYELGIYSGAFKIVTILTLLKQSFSNLWVPMAYRWKKENVPIERFYTMSRLVIAGMGLVFFIVSLFRNQLILILNYRYRPAAILIPFLLLIPAFYTISETLVLGINFARKTHYHIWISLISASVNLAGNALLVPQYGALGAAVSTGISYFVFVAVRTFFSRRAGFRMPLRTTAVLLIIMLAGSFSTLANNMWLEIPWFVLFLMLGRKEYYMMKQHILLFVRERFPTDKDNHANPSDKNV